MLVEWVAGGWVTANPGRFTVPSAGSYCPRGRSHTRRPFDADDERLLAATEQFGSACSAQRQCDALGGGLRETERL